MPATVQGMLLDGDHASRPAANAAGLPVGSLYSCSDHSLIYQTDGSSWATWADLTGTGGSVATDAIWDAAGDLAVGSGANTAAKLTAGSEGDVLTIASGVPAWEAPSVGGASFRSTAAIAYPTTFDGSDTLDAADLEAAATDVDAFTSRAVDGDIWRLTNTGSAATGVVRIALGTTKAAAFDVRTCVTPWMARWSANGDVYCQVRLSQSDDTQIALMRMHAFFGGVASAMGMDLRTKLGTGSPAGAGSDLNPQYLVGHPVWLRVTRDGSNNVLAFWGIGRQPMAWMPILDGGIKPMTASVSGTLARVEYSVVHPSSDANHQSNLYVDFLTSV